MELQLQDLTYRVGQRRLIDSINLRSATQRCTALLGGNGAGKSLLLRLCHGLLVPSDGKVLWDARSPSDCRRDITMVFQKPILLRRSVRQNIAHALFLQGISNIERAARIDEALQKFGMVQYQHHHASVLSGGQQQRLAIARAWALHPAVILMDEPTSDLDMRSIAMVEDLIQSLSDSGIKIIMTSHNLAQVRRLCDEVIFMHEGRLICHLPIDDFFNNTQDEQVCEFIESQAF